jgi:hypothetical protein
MMRTLNISNYEEWMMDLMDGVLNIEETERLEFFLAQHPELSVDLDLMQEAVLVPDESVSLPKKASLKRDELEDEAIIAFIEEGGDIHVLNDADRNLASIYARTILEADERIFFPHKALLKQSEGRIIPLWFKAASIAATLLLAFFLLPSDENPVYEAREGGPIAWDTFEFDSPSDVETLPLAETNLKTEPSESDELRKRTNQIEGSEPLLVDIIDIDSELPDNPPSDESVLTDEPLTDLPEQVQEEPSNDFSPEDKDMELADNNPVSERPEYTPVSKKLQAERPYTTALDLLKKATAGSDILAIQDVDPEGAYVQTSLKLGRFEVAVKRKKKN